MMPLLLVTGPTTMSQGVFEFVRTRADAVVPRRAFDTDTGFDVSIVGFSHSVGKTMFFHTGLRVAPPPGVYFDLVARSSISKTGYMLANGIGVIDRSYRGEVLVPLVKIDEDAGQLPLPCRIVQLVPRSWHDMRGVEVAAIDDTERGAGGFGSTGGEGGL